MTDWSRDMAEKLRKRSEHQNIQDAKFVEQQRIKREVGPRLWDAVKSDIRAEGKALNAELGKELITEGPGSSPNELALFADLDPEPRDARVVFSPAEGKLTYIVRGPKSKNAPSDIFEVSIGRDGKPAFYSGMIPYSTGSIAKQILESLLD